MESKGTAVKTTWTLISGTPNYINELGWKCVYVRTVKGYATYKTYTDKGVPYGVGGLPSFIKV